MQKSLELWGFLRPGREAKDAEKAVLEGEIQGEAVQGEEKECRKVRRERADGVQHHCIVLGGVKLKGELPAEKLPNAHQLKPPCIAFVQWADMPLASHDGYRSLEDT